VQRFFLAIALVLAGSALAWYVITQRSREPVAMRVLLTEPCVREILAFFDGIQSIRRSGPSIEIIGLDGLPEEFNQFVGFAEIRSSDVDLDFVRDVVRSTYLGCSATDRAAIELGDPLLAAKLRAELRRQQLGGYIGTNVRMLDGDTLEVFGAFPQEP
jgi:hypothetical protein